MKIYVGGVLNQRLAPDLKLNILESYFAIGRRDLKIDSGYCKSFFLDSGAFSAWNSNKSINLANYINYLKLNKDKINHYANLDEIGNPVKSQENLLKMEAEGLKPMPVFHYGEDLKIFDEMRKKYEYIALGGMVPISTKVLKVWLDSVFERMCEKDGSTKTKIHGFGMTTLELMKRYPWYSVDSVSCTMSAINGAIFNDDGKVIPLGRGERIPYQTELYLKGLGDKKHSCQKELTYDQLRTSDKARMIINLRFFMKLEEELTLNPPRYINNQGKLL